MQLTPVEKIDEIFIKRDDLFSFGGVSGGKVRTCEALARKAKLGLVTAGSRFSPQVNIVAHVAKALALACQIHTPQGELGPEVQEAVRLGANLIQHKAGYNSVIVARCKEAAEKTGYTEIPFGMECQEAIDQTSKQVENVPWDQVKRIVMPIGSGMSCAGVINGLFDLGIRKPILGIQVGADPYKRLDNYAPFLWKTYLTVEKSRHDYHKRLTDVRLSGILLDSIYESKCAEFIEPGDLFWIVGIRKSEMGE